MVEDEAQEDAGSMRRCAVKGCKAEAFWHPVLCIEGPTVLETTRAEVEIPLCGHHKQNCTIGDIVSDENWSALREGFMMTGRADPKRSELVLDFKHFSMGYLS